MDVLAAKGDGAEGAEIIGEALRGRRDRYVIATKVSPVTDDPDEVKARRRIEKACEESLRRLQTDYIDVYQLHVVPHESTMPVVMDTLARLKTDGKIRWFGISIHDTNAVPKLLALGDLSMLQVSFNLVNRSGEEALRLAQVENLGTLIKSPLQQGVLSGKYFNMATRLDPEDRRREHFADERAVSALKKLSALLFLADGGSRTLVQAALRFVLDTPGVTSVIPSAKNRAQLQENAEAAEIPPLGHGERSRAMAIADAAGLPIP